MTSDHELGLPLKKIKRAGVEQCEHVAGERAVFRMFIVHDYTNIINWSKVVVTDIFFIFFGHMLRLFS